MSQYQVIKPFAYQTTTPPVHPTGTSASTRSGGASSFLSGAAGFAGLASDIWQAVYAKRRAEEANKLSFKAAADSSARASAEARAARNWNSEQAQIRRMRMAGLSPGLAYGQMSPSTAVAAPQDKADVHKADTPKFDNESLLRALELLVKQQQANTASAAQESTAELQGSQVDLNKIDQLYRAAEYQANISSILANKELTDAKKIEIIQLLESRQNNLDAATRNLNAAANVSEKTGVDLANSQIASNNASAAVNTQQAAILKLTYDLDNAQWISIQKFMKDNGFDDSLAPLVMKALSSIANNTGKTLESVLSSLSSLPGSIVENYLEKFMSGDSKKGRRK